MAKKYVALQMRFPSKMHEVIKRIADNEHRTFNGQVIYWLENGGIPSDLLDEVKADIALALAGVER